MCIGTIPASDIALSFSTTWLLSQRHTFVEFQDAACVLGGVQ